MNDINENMFRNGLHQAIKNKIQEIIQEETEKAKKEVVRRIESMTDSLALSLVKQYEIETRTDRLVITVRK